MSNVDRGLQTQIVEHLKPLKVDFKSFSVFQSGLPPVAAKRKNKPSSTQFSVKTVVSEPLPTAAHLSSCEWRVSQGTIPQKKSLCESETGDDRSQSEWSMLDKLKVSALACMLARQTDQSMCITNKNGSASVELFSHFVVFDLVSASQSVAGFERQQATLARKIHAHLNNIFVCVLDRLLQGFVSHYDKRADRQILQFVARAEPNLFAHNATFDFTSKHVELARQYVYSAIQDGQLLDFSNSENVPSVNATEKVPPLNPEPTSMLEKTMYDIECQTEALLNRHSLFNELLHQCVSGAEETKLANLVNSICQTAQKNKFSNGCEFLHFCALGKNGSKSHSKSTKLCCAALTNETTLKSGALNQLDRCGFFDDTLTLACVVESGCLARIEDANARQFLLQKILDNADVFNQLLAQAQSKSAVDLVKRFLWLAYLGINVMTRSNLKHFKVTEISNTNNELMTEKLYKWIQSNVDPAFWRSIHQHLHNFYLKNGQYFLALKTQQLIGEIIQPTNLLDNE